MNINDYLLEPECIYAHSSDTEDKENETLTDHSALVLAFFHKLSLENGLRSAIEKCCFNLVQRFAPHRQAILHDKLVTLIEKAVHLHDIGKINPKFQDIKMNNTALTYNRKELKRMNTRHSSLSSILFHTIIKKEWSEESFTETEEMFLNQMLYTAMYMISKHHGQLEDVYQEDQDLFKERLTVTVDDLSENPSYVMYFRSSETVIPFLNESIWGFIRDCDEFQRKSHASDPFDQFIYGKLLFSSIVTSDFYATYTYMNNATPTFHFFTSPQKQSLRTSYEHQEMIRNIRSTNKKDMSEMNRLRSELFLEAEHTLKSNPDGPLYYLEAPTGSGKTNTSINLALQLLNQDEQLNKILYVFPFNTLTEQTEETFRTFLPDDQAQDIDISVINSITPIMPESKRHLSEESFRRSAKEALLRRQMIQSPITLTSHVNFFDYLFGTSRESHLGFVHLCNSVIVLDEVQGYKNDIWKPIIHFLKRYAEILNIKLILMSATLPPLEELLDTSEKPVYLLPRAPYYFSHPLFKNRVSSLDFSLLQVTSPSDFEEKKTKMFEMLLQKVHELYDRKNNNRILFEFITKSSARAFTTFLKDRFPTKPIFELTGLDSKHNRQYILNLLKQTTNNEFVHQDVILIATQVIEAGVDIDMDFGFKDISILDSEEQFLGRINRSSRRSDSKVWFFNLDYASKLYKNDWRIEHDLTELQCQQYLLNKDFRAFYQNVIQRLNQESIRRKTNNFDLFREELSLMKHETIKKKMTLINSKTITLFMNYEIDGVCGQELWESYKNLLSNRELDYSEKKVRLSQLLHKMTDYTFSVYSDRPIQCSDDDIIGDLHYIHNGEQYMLHDQETGMVKFDFESFQSEQKSIFI